mmetsp:Transcript_4513/g.5599  ORF Transcript_4513/g.5599 Transcript_4513/m.5599 type:complete len:101 (-) Transcript_4513:86-388(-)
MCSLTVYDESHSCTMLLPDGVFGDPEVFNSLVAGKSVLVLRNACTILDSSNRLILTMASPKYSSIQVYNPKQQSSPADGTEAYNDDEVDEDWVISGFCED